MLIEILLEALNKCLEVVNWYEFCGNERKASFWGILSSGLASNLFRSKKHKARIPNISMNSSEEENISTSDEIKDFLSSLWLLEKEIKKAEINNEWVRLYCLLQTLRYLFENDWIKFTEGNFSFQEFLDNNILSLLNYVQDMQPETTIWPKISQEVKDTLDRGGLNVELDNYSYTFNGSNLQEEPWPEALLEN
jgi:hypothetical protein